MSKRKPRAPGASHRPWQKAETRQRQAHEDQEARARGRDYTRRMAAAIDREGLRGLFKQNIEDMRTGWEQSGNLDYLLSAIKWCGYGDCCPQWVAATVVEFLGKAVTDEGAELRKWWEIHKRELIDVQRHDCLEDARRRGGLTEREAADFASDQLLGSVFHAGREAMRRSARIVRQAERSHRGRRYFIGPLGRAWLEENRPRKILDAFVNWHPRFRLVRVERGYRQPR